MREILRTTDHVLLSFVESLLREAGLQFHIADRHISVVEGGISAFQCRVLVVDDDEQPARRLLIDAGLAGELRPEPTAAELAHLGRTRPA